MKKALAVFAATTLIATGSIAAATSASAAPAGPGNGHDWDALCDGNASMAMTVYVTPGGMIWGYFPQPDGGKDWGATGGYEAIADCRTHTLFEADGNRIWSPGDPWTPFGYVNHGGYLVSTNRNQKPEFLDIRYFTAPVSSFAISGHTREPIPFPEGWTAVTGDPAAGTSPVIIGDQVAFWIGRDATISVPAPSGKLTWAVRKALEEQRVALEKHARAQFASIEWVHVMHKGDLRNLRVVDGKVTSTVRYSVYLDADLGLPIRCPLLGAIARLAGIHVRAVDGHRA